VQVEEWIEFSQNTQHSLLFGSSSPPLKGSVRRMVELDDLLFSNGCFQGVLLSSSPG